MGRRTQVVLLVLVLCSMVITAVPDTRAQSDSVRILLEVQAGVAWDDATLDQTVAIVESRLNGLSLAEAIVQREEDRIVVEVPRDAVDAALLEALLKPGLLEFVDFSAIASGAIEDGACILTTEQILLAEARLPSDATAPAYTDYTCADGLTAEQAQLNDGQPFQTIMTGAGIADAAAEAWGGIGNQFTVTFSLKEDGDRVDAFIDHVANHPNTAMAIVLDGRLLSAPTIQPGLSDAARAGTMDGGVITGKFTQAGAELLAAQISYGAFPIPLQIVDIEG